MTIPRTLPDQVADLYRRLGEVERRSRNRKRTGVVDQVDHAKGLYRVKLSEQDGKKFVTDWIKTRQIGAGLVKVDVLYKVGEQVDVVSENGDLTDAIIDLNTYSNQNPRENESTPMLITIGDARIAVKDDSILFKVGGTTLELKGSKILIDAPKIETTGNSITHNEHEIGNEHVHRDVALGDDLSGPPV